MNVTNQNFSYNRERRSRSGPINPLHKIYLRNDRRIQKEIFKAVARRDISVRISNVCRNIDISPPTFYLHYSSCNEVLSHYELDMINDFRNNLPTVQNYVTIFSLLLIFMGRHRKYFKASFQSHSFYMLHQLLQELRPVLVRADIGDEVYLHYAAALTAHIAWWGVYEKFSADAIPACAKKLARVRMMRV